MTRNFGALRHMFKCQAPAAVAMRTEKELSLSHVFDDSPDTPRRTLVAYLRLFVSKPEGEDPPPAAAVEADGEADRAQPMPTAATV